MLWGCLAVGKLLLGLFFSHLFCSLSDPLSHFPSLDTASIYTYTYIKKTPPLSFHSHSAYYLHQCLAAGHRGILLSMQCYSGWVVGCALPGGWPHGWVLESLQTSSGLVQTLMLDVPIYITATSLF